ncbi:hypothetical protein QYE76_038616 [Lolium multiflorum]|uniref:DUF3615 domain-containing protein n=1 Tax=Lolium multiflorum TaxID=4521 RepID=A0AAD8T9V2_LOLMU|nr:hypothetical protein QYE76_038616 [Lolium multiflorum]
MVRKGCAYRGPRTEKDTARPHAQKALHHYNSKNPAAQFDLVEPLICNRVGFREAIWFHVNFLARPRQEKNFARSSNSLPDTDVQHFFAELHYRGSNTPVVETCIILEKLLGQFKIKCAFCKGTLGILHPIKEEFVCGRSSAQKKEYYQICMWTRMPKKYASPPQEEPTSVQRQVDQMPLEA